MRPKVKLLNSCPYSRKTSKFSQPATDIAIISLSNNRMVGKLLVPAAFKIGSKVWVRCLRVIEGHTEGVSI